MKKLFSFFRRISVISLVLIMIFSSADAIAYASQANPTTFYFEETCENPVYHDALGGESEALQGEVVNQTRFDADDSTERQIRENAIIVRDNMLARNSEFYLKLRTMRRDYSSIIAQTFKLAVSEELAETTNAGDYLAWHYGGYTYSGTAEMVDGQLEYTFTVRVPYFTTAQQEEQVALDIDNTLREMNLEGATEYDKIKAIYDYVCKTCDYCYDYDENNRTKFSAYGAIEQGSAVCQGYSSLLYRMLREAGLQARVVTSYSHSWNIVKLGNEYYNIDATWDDDYYDAGQNYKYFLKCNEHFADHEREPQFETAEFNAAHPMTLVCYYDEHPEKFEDKTRNVSSPVCKTHDHVLLKTVNATCTQPGYQLYGCRNCNAQKKVELKARGHSEVIDKAVAPTFANAGKTQGSHCAVCKKVLVAQKTVAKLTVGNVNIKGLKAKSKGFSVSWQKVANATGYEIQYSTSNKFTAKTTKTINVGKNTTVSKAVSKLKGKTKYYIRIRAYKIENSKKYYSSWTKVKNVTTKK